MNLQKLLTHYQPINEQERVDQAVMLDFFTKNSNAFLREDQIAHFCASAYIVNPARTKMLLCFHNIYQQWAYFGGHADGDEDMLAVAKKEVSEESGLQDFRVISDEIFTLETSSVNRHIKHGKYVPAHLHFDIDFLFETDDQAKTIIKPDENSDIRWFDFSEITPELVGASRYEACYTKVFAKLKRP